MYVDNLIKRAYNNSIKILWRLYMDAYRKWIDSLPLLVKIIFALPILDGILFGIYRICKGNLPNIVLGIIWIFVGATIFWVLDIIFLLWKGKVLEL